MWRTQMWQVRTYDMSGEWWMPTVGRRVLGIVLEGLFEMLDRLLESGPHPPLSGQRHATQIGIVGSDVLGGAFLNIALFLRAELEVQPLGDLQCRLFLHGEDVLH